MDRIIREHRREVEITKDIVSIEETLNSRCSSDFKVGSKKSHWGAFIDQRPSQKIIDNILQCIKIPRFSNGKLAQWFRNEYLFVGFEKPNDPFKERVLHIESGMQQQAVYLACTTQGVGTCIHNEGINGTEYEEKVATAKHLMMEAADPYDSGKLTMKSPGPEKPFKVGKNLSEPSRHSDTECLPQLEHVTSFSKSGSSATKEDISQLLWAAKGRTPHLIRMHAWNLMWGLTIPTWAGGQDYTSVYLVEDDSLFIYRNWTKDFSLLNRLFRQKFGWTRGNPTHDIRFVRKLNIRSELDGHDTAIVLCRNEKANRALWEVGYMLENMLIQARSLNVSYESKIFNIEEISQLAELGLANAAAAVLL